jgi:valyl-tRNA synthetase
VTVSRQDPTECAHCASKDIEQDPDVLDTWFSAGLWPFSTLGWPEASTDYKYFYPTTMMETGYDILFFWVARMIMFGLEFTGDIPFDTVYLHGLIRDESGRKMSKTYGNVIDPLEVMNELGTDALRFTLLVGSTPGNDMNLSIKRVEANRNFANKIWNAGRFVISNIHQTPTIPVAEPDWTLADSWIWARMQSLIKDVERLFQNYQYGEAGRQIYDFFWGEFADWYLEVAKLQMVEGGDLAFYTVQTLTRVLDLCLRLLHPFTPFVTEELWGHLKNAAQDSSVHLTPKGGWPEALILAPWPEKQLEEGWEASKIADFNLIREVVRAIRNLRSEKNVQPGRRIPATLVSSDYSQILNEQAASLSALAHLDDNRLFILDALPSKPVGNIALVVGSVEIYLPLVDLVDVGEEKIRLEKDFNDTKSQIRRLEQLLASPFAEKAPPAVIQKERDKLRDYQDTAAKISKQLNDLG